jgi:hypothetical protein
MRSAMRGASAPSSSEISPGISHPPGARAVRNDDDTVSVLPRGGCSQVCMPGEAATYPKRKEVSD